ncbi:MutS-like mismatch repair protein, ATPase [Bdellovibrio bacteriovorus W]|nr:MutS-like mismatch repair protein, ATPase [Bdellovibrio bacteriovorus W]
MNTQASSSQLIRHSLVSIRHLSRRLEKTKSLHLKFQTQLDIHRNRRLILGIIWLLTLASIAFPQNTELKTLLSLGFFIPFLVLVRKTKKINAYVTELKELSHFYERQLARTQGLPPKTSHEYAEKKARALGLPMDLGLVGPHSLWTLLNETITHGGQDRLLKWMKDTPEFDALLVRQNSLRKFLPHTWFYTKLKLRASQKEIEDASDLLLQFLKTPLVGNSFSKLFYANWILWIATFALALYSTFTQTLIPTWAYAFFPLLSMMSLSAASTVFGNFLGINVQLEVLTPIFHQLEKETQKSEFLQTLTPNIYKASPAKSARKLEWIMGLLGTQTNPLLHFFINLISPWTVTAAYLAEKERRAIEKNFPACLDELFHIEALGSLTLLFKYQTRSFPELTSSEPLMGKQFFHPLLPREQTKANDFHFTLDQRLGLLTGSNMSGKSTFLRTIGTNQILANMGAPVFADSMKTHVMEVETCITVSDSLSDGFSYFYAEVRKLKSILEKCRRGDRILFLIDEIFKGTNNKERQIGSRSVIASLAATSTACGFVSTHDLELTNLSEENSSVFNLHFRDKISDDGKMFFTYELGLGPSPTTNALIIMANEGLISEGLAKS